MQVTCQLLLVVLLIWQALAMVWCDFNGNMGRGPYGFRGFLVTLGIVVIEVGVLTGAGAFSQLF